MQEAALRSVVGVQSADEDPRGHSGARPFSPHRGPVRTSKLQAQSGFDGEQWTGSTSQLLCAKPAAPTQIDEHEHDDPHVLIESHVVITTDIYPIDSRARGVGWVAWFDCLPLP